MEVAEQGSLSRRANLLLWRRDDHARAVQEVIAVASEIGHVISSRDRDSLLTQLESASLAMMVGGF